MMVQMDLVLHDIPEAVGDALRDRAAATGVTINAVAADVLGRAWGVPHAPLTPGPPYHDLDWLLDGEPLEQAVLDAIAEADVVHPEQDHKIDEWLAAERAADVGGRR